MAWWQPGAPRPLFTVLGFPVYAPLTAWLGIALIAYLNAPAFEEYGGIPSTLAFAVGLYATVLVHELAHAITARATGHQVLAITLGVLGGATLYDAEVRPNPKHQFRVALAGPLTSIAIGFVLGAVPGSGNVGAVLAALGFMNVVLGLFNLLPAAPLDGGHVCEALVWRITRSRRKGMRVTAVLGILIGALLFAGGLGATDLLNAELSMFFGTLLFIDASLLWRNSRRYR